jgi:shikimate dehydrogenase
MSQVPMKRAFVVGWPIKHSRSPIIHGHWLKTFGLAGTYERLAVEPGAFPAFAASVGQDGIVGANVTLPHKQAAFAACEVTTDVATSLGAVNTLWREDGRLNGDNTDVAGFLANCDEAAPGWDSSRGTALVLGAGGAARAICYGLLQRGFRVAIANRTLSHAQDLAAHFGERVVALGREAEARDVAGANVIVNTTSLGMVGQPPLFVDLTAARADAVVADLVYVPLETELILAARRRGLRAVGGLGMLLHQAVDGFERWFGVRPKVDDELRALVEADVRRSQ